VYATSQNQNYSISKQRTIDTFKNKLDVIDKVNPVVRGNIKEEHSNEVRFEGKEKDIKFDLKEGKITINKSTNFQIELPKTLSYQFEGDRVIGYDHTGNISNSIENVDGGFRIVINIYESKASTYSYELPLVAISGEKYISNEDGTVWLVDSKGKRLFAIAHPWAVDAKNKNLKTWYTVENDGTVLRQHISLKGVSFPVIADPSWCGNTVSDIYWGYWDGHGSLYSVNPTWCGRLSSNTSALWNDMLSIKPINWTEWARYLGKSEQSIKSSMWHQLECHNVFAFFQKDRYNLDIWRRDAPTYWEQYNYSCNVN